MRAYVPGIYPRSERLIRATRDLERGRATPESVEAAFLVDLGAFVNAQRAAGLDLLADGLLAWQDLFRALVETADGLEVGPLTRFLDTNTFYRAPLATSAAPMLRSALDELYVPPLEGPRVVTLPSPFALAYGTNVRPATMARNVLKPQLDALEVELVVLAEPFLARVEEPDLDPLAEALGLLVGGPPLALQLPFADARVLLERGLEDLPVQGIGIDFFATHDADIPLGFRKTLLAGVVDARSSALEEPQAIAAFVDRLDARAVIDIDLVPNGDLQFVPEPIAREKLARLAQARELHDR